MVTLKIIDVGRQNKKKASQNSLFLSFKDKRKNASKVCDKTHAINEKKTPCGELHTLNVFNGTQGAHNFLMPRPANWNNPLIRFQLVYNWY